MNVVLTTAGAKILRALYEADRDNVYINPADVTFLLMVRTPAFENEFWKFEPTGKNSLGLDDSGNEIEIPVTRVTLKKYDARTADGTVINDGATFAPDAPTGVKAAAALHDPGYLSINDMVWSWYKSQYDPGPLFSRDFVARIGSKFAANTSYYWTESDIRQLMDSIFGATIRYGGGRSWITRTYYSAVRYFGGIFRLTKRHIKLLLICAALATLTGCNGCMAPPDIVDFPSGLPAPERAESGDLTGPVLEIIRESISQ